MSSRTALAVATLTLVVGYPALAISPEQKCAVLKLKASGKKLAAKMNCYAKGKAKALPADPACLTKAETKFAAAIMKAGNACPGTAVDLEAAVDASVGQLVADVPGDGTCPSSIVKAAGRAGKGLLMCQAKATTQGPASLPPCDVKNSTKLAATVQKVGSCADASVIDANVHSGDSAIAAIIDGTATSTTTTSMSTTSSTTTTVPRFMDNMDGTVTDMQTGLQWEEKTTEINSGANAADLHDVDNVYSWAGKCTINPGVYCQPDAAAAATCAAQSNGGTFGCGQCGGGDGTCNVDPYAQGAITTVWKWLNDVNAAGFAGHSDWRLPSESGCNSCYQGGADPGYNCPCTASELETILPYPSILGPSADNYYWSASADMTSPDYAWIVGFNDGPVNESNEPAAWFVRAVR